MSPPPGRIDSRPRLVSSSVHSSFTVKSRGRKTSRFLVHWRGRMALTIADAVRTSFVKAPEVALRSMSRSY